MSAHHPTTDLYFWNSCSVWAHRWWRRGAIRPFGENSFRCGTTLVLLRRDVPEIMQAATAWSGRLIYVIDDDIDAAAQAPSLPDGYRQRLTQFAQTHYDGLLRRADIVVASSDALAQRLAADSRIKGDIVRLDPYWDLPPADQSHFRDASRRFDISHLGSASHSGGLRGIAPTISKLIDEAVHLHFSYVGARGLHPALEGHARIHRISPMGWPRYRRWLARRRFHLALYPLEDSRFDRARSTNKLLEHAIVGAAGIYPFDWSPAAIVGDGAMTAPADPTQWEGVLREAIADPPALARRARMAAQALAPYQDPTMQRQFWIRWLGLEAA